MIGANEVILNSVCKAENHIRHHCSSTSLQTRKSKIPPFNDKVSQMAGYLSCKCVIFVVDLTWNSLSKTWDFVTPLLSSVCNLWWMSDLFFVGQKKICSLALIALCINLCTFVWSFSSLWGYSVVLSSLQASCATEWVRPVERQSAGQWAVNGWSLFSTLPTHGSYGGFPVFWGLQKVNFFLDNSSC